LNVPVAQPRADRVTFRVTRIAWDEDHVRDLTDRGVRGSSLP